MKTIHIWKYQHNRNKFWTIDFDYLQAQLQTRNHNALQAFDENNQRVTNPNGGITFPVNWDLTKLDFSQKNVPQTLIGEPVLPEGIEAGVAPTIEVWFMEYIPTVEPWVTAPTPLPEKPLTVIYNEKLLSPQEWIIEGEAGFRVIHLPHLKPVWFKQTSIISDGVDVIVDVNQRVIQINTNSFEGKKELCRLKISGTSPWEKPEFNYIHPYNSTRKGFNVDLYEIKENDVPILFATKGKVITYPLSVWEQAKIDYKNNHYEWIEKTQIQPPLQIVNGLSLPDNCLISIQNRLVKVQMGRQWNDVIIDNPKYPDESPYPLLTIPGMKRAFEGLAANVTITMKNGDQVINVMAASQGNYNPDVPGIYQPEVSLSIPDVPNPLGLIHKVWIVVQNEDGTDPPGVDEFFRVKWFEPVELTVPQHYPEELLKGHFHGLNYPDFAGFAQKGYFVTDYARLSEPINWGNSEFNTDEIGTFEITGEWNQRYPFTPPDVLANPPKVVLHVVGKDTPLPIIEDDDLPPEQKDLLEINKVSINDLKILESISGIGPATINNLDKARKESPFIDKDDITRAHRVGPVTADLIHDFGVSYSV